MEVTPSNKRSRGKRCVAFGCGNTSLDGVSVHYFPLDRPEISKLWTIFVQRKRDLWDGPTKHSVLCSEHFTEDCYPLQYRLLQTMGRTPPKKKTLNKDAVPTIHKVNIDIVEETPVKRPRTAFTKRENRRILEQCLKDSETQQAEGVIQPDHDDASTPSSSTIDHDYSSNNQKQTPSKMKTCGTQMSLKPPKRRTIRIQVASNIAEKGCQTRAPKPKVRDVEVQCNLLKPPVNDDMELLNQPECEEEDDLDVTMSSVGDELDNSYHPDSDLDASLDTEMDVEENEDMLHTDHRDRQFLVEENKLLELFDRCRYCLAPCYGEVTRVIGTMVVIYQDCAMCGKDFKWRSQSMVGSLPRGNIQLSSSILFSGSLPSKALRIFRYMDVPVICRDTFSKHQRHYLQPTILKMWNDKQQGYFQELSQNTEIHMGGDGRCDTPGHCAKFCSYSLMDLDKGTIVDVQLVQSNEVTHSVNMEKEGLIRCVDKLKQEGININTLVTDRHVQIRKWVRENMTETHHCFDVWHVAKGLKKKLLALSKEKDCGELEKWIKSITNHMYWVPASTPSGDGALLYQKWTSVINHIQNIHDGHGELFPCCLHGDLGTRARKKKWIKPESKLMEKLELVLTSTQIKKDIPMLSSNVNSSPDFGN